jgi:hypothetical protein
VFSVLLQTLFIVSLCNNQLLYLMEKELIWIFGHIPGFSATLPSVIAKLHAAKEKYLSPPSPASSSLQVEVCIFSTKRGHLSLDDLALFISFLFLLIGSLMHDKISIYRKNNGISLLRWFGIL